MVPRAASQDRMASREPRNLSLYNVLVKDNFLFGDETRYTASSTLNVPALAMIIGFITSALVKVSFVLLAEAVDAGLRTITL